MNVPDIIIAVDGFSSTGKSTFAKMVAKEFGFLYLDSGAMYRGVTLAGMEAGVIGDGKIDEEGLRKIIGPLQLHFRQEEGNTRLYLGERCIETEIRGWDVSQYVSPVSAIPWVRNWVDERLHAFSEGGRVIMDGRDIGTTVFPNAELKIFMTADEQVRARFEEEVAAEEGPLRDHDDPAAVLRSQVDDLLDGRSLNHSGVYGHSIVSHHILLTED